MTDEIYEKSNKHIANFLGGGFWQLNKAMVKAFGLSESLWITNLYDHRTQLIRTEKISEDDYFFITQEKIYLDTGIYPDLQSTYIKKFIEQGFLKIKRKGLPCRNYYYIDSLKLMEIIDLKNQVLDPGFSGNLNLDLPAPSYLKKPDLDTLKKPDLDTLKKPDHNNNINRNNGFSSKEEKLSCATTQSVSDKDGIKIIRSKTLTQKHPLSQEEFMAMEGYSDRAKNLLLYWNSLGQPIPYHPIKNILSKTCKNSLKTLDHIINQGYSDEEIRSSFQNYYKLLTLDHCKLYQSSMAVRTSLSEFIEPSPLIRKRLLESRINIKSWFQECLAPWDCIWQKYTKEAKNPYPIIVETLKEMWKKEVPHKKFTIDDENIFRKTAEKIYNFFVDIKDFRCISGYNNKYPATCTDLIIMVLQKEGYDFERVPFWLGSENFIRNKLEPYLKEMGYIIDGYDSYCNEQEEERLRRIKGKEAQEEKDRAEAALSELD
ncbi:MAG: hypothetical protein WC428_07855 [Candidatus Paceibacterota bacterium]|jgi:hypothetical protein